MGDCYFKLSLGLKELKVNLVKKYASHVEVSRIDQHFLLFCFLNTKNCHFSLFLLVSDASFTSQTVDLSSLIPILTPIKILFRNFFVVSPCIYLQFGAVCSHVLCSTEIVTCD